MYKITMGLLAMACVARLQGQTTGCTDPQATNFNASATTNNGSCTYANTNYTPPFVANLGSAINEVSGLVMVNGRLYGHNDGGTPNAIYRLDTATGNILQTIVLQGTTNVDWEDMTQDSTHLYVADVGNNATGIRTDLVIYKFAKQLIASDTVTVVPAASIERIYFSYADQTNFTTPTPNNTRFDCEAVVVLRNQLHLFTKNWVSPTTVHYRLPTQAGTHVATRLDSMATGGFMITGAAVAGYDNMMLTAYTRLGSCALFLVFGFNDDDGSNNFFATAHKRRISLPSALQLGQLESIVFINPLRGFLATEAFSAGGINLSQRLYKFNTEAYISDHYRRNTPQFAQPGMLRFNSSSDAYEWFDGAGWQRLH